MRPRAWLLALGLPLAACAAPDGRPAEAAPQACATGFEHLAPVLNLPPAQGPAEDDTAGKSAPLKFANADPVGRGPGQAGLWSEGRSGWAAWRLRLRSEGARSLSVHLQPFEMPAGAGLWLCTPDGGRQGPYGSEQMTDFWSPALSGPELWLELQVPAQHRAEVRMKVIEAFAAYR